MTTYNAFYYFGYFLISIDDVNNLDRLDSLSDIEFNKKIQVLIHEYIHYLQNITSIWGAFASCSLITQYYEVKEYLPQKDIPFKLHNRIYLDFLDTLQISGKLLNITDITYSKFNIDTNIVTFDTPLGKQEIRINNICFAENITTKAEDILQSLLPTQVQPRNIEPYYILDIIVKGIYPTLLQYKISVLVLYEYCLNHEKESIVLLICILNIMKTNTFKPSDYNSVLDFCNDLYGHLNFNADFIEKTKLVKDGLIDIFKGFEEFREVTEYTYNQAISIKQKCICPITKFVYDFSNIGYSKKEILDYLDAAFNTLGFPLLAFKQEKIPFHSEIVSPFYSLFLLHDILEVINGRKNAGKIYENDTNNKKALCECSLLPLCKHIGEYEVDETCEEVPWLRLQYHTIDCPFTMMWKIFKLQEYFSYNEDMGIFVRNNKDIE